MTPEESFSERFRYEVNELGNLIRGLEMAADFVSASSSLGVRHELSRAVGSILARLPSERVRPDLRASLEAAFGAGAFEATTGRAEPSSDAVPAPPNVVLMPLIADDHRLTGAVRRFWVTAAEPYSQNANHVREARDDFRRAIEDGCVKARAKLERCGIFDVRRIPHDYEFCVERGAFGCNPALREESGWLAAALSYFSLGAGLPVPGQVAATGYETADGKPGPLEHVEAKIDACLREWPRLDRFLVMSRAALPERYREHAVVRRVGSFKEAVALLWGAEWRNTAQPARMNLRAAIDRAMYAYAEEHDICGAFERFSMIDRFFAREKGNWVRFRFLCDWRLACCHNHMGNRDEATRLFTRWADRVESLWRDGVIDSENHANFFSSYGYFLARTGEIDRGLELVHRALDLAGEHWTPRMHRAKLLGALGRLLMADRDFPAAESALQEALILADEADQLRRRLELARLYVEWARIGDAKRLLAECDAGEHQGRHGGSKANTVHRMLLFRQIGIGAGESPSDVVPRNSSDGRGIETLTTG